MKTQQSNEPRPDEIAATDRDPGAPEPSARERERVRREIERMLRDGEVPY